MGNSATIQEQEPLPTSPEELYGHLEGIGVSFEVFEHKPVFTVAESTDLKKKIPGLHCRNLFLRDKKKKMFLVVAANETMIDLKKLQDVIGSDRLSFGSSDRLWENLGVRPGSVCPFAIINDKDNNVSIILDKYMMEAELVNYHPLENDKTIGLTPDGLVKFVESCGHDANIVDLGPAAPDES